MQRHAHSRRATATPPETPCAALCVRHAALPHASSLFFLDFPCSYRTCAQVTNWYSLESFADLYGMPVTPFEQKVHGLAYINSNCGAQSGRSDIMRALMKLNGSVPVHSMGRCDTNKPWPGGNKRQVRARRAVGWVGWGVGCGGCGGGWG